MLASLAFSLVSPSAWPPRPYHLRMPPTLRPLKCRKGRALSNLMAQHSTARRAKVVTCPMGRVRRARVCTPCWQTIPNWLQAPMSLMSSSMGSMECRASPTACPTTRSQQRSTTSEPVLAINIQIHCSLRTWGKCVEEPVPDTSGRRKINVPSRQNGFLFAGGERNALRKGAIEIGCASGTPPNVASRESRKSRDKQR
jgi:hypothetical protein